MHLFYDIDVQVSGEEHQSKTTLVAYLAGVLTEAGVKVIVQKADAQIDQKLELPLATLKEKLAGKTIFLREVELPA